MKLSVREKRETDIKNIVDYFLNATPEHLRAMGADHSKLPDRKTWTDTLYAEFKKEYPEKLIYYVIWEEDKKAIGHSNINQLVYGKRANMHLHLWNPEKRKKGMGQQLVKASLPFYFKNFKLEELYCEPYALNPAPNKTLPKVGFEFIKAYETTPGEINLPQKVNQYLMTKEKFKKI